MPENAEIDLEQVIALLPGIMPEGVEVIETKIAPVAFGLMKVTAGFLIDDSDESIGSKLEEVLLAIEGIDNVECISSTVI